MNIAPVPNLCFYFDNQKTRYTETERETTLLYLIYYFK